jgi:hypothetical protein
MKIGFYGDSFSAEKRPLPPSTFQYKTYIRLLEKEFKTNINIRSYGGCSHWDIIINQFLPDINNLPDVCIFTWPDEHRLFHRKVRHIRLNDALEYSKISWKIAKIGYSFGFFKNEWQAAEMYYKHLYDTEKNDLEYKSSLYYFDNVILEKIKNKKFIHLWSFEKKHNWKNNIALDQSLLSIAENMIPDYHEPNHLVARNKNYDSANHLPTQEVNDCVFEKVRDLINEVRR